MNNKSNAWDIILMEKRKYDKLFIIWIITFIALVISVCYSIYLSQDIGTIETTTVEQSDADNNNYIGNDGDIINGNTKDN